MMQKICPKCGKPMIYGGIDTIRGDSGEHYLCHKEKFWQCSDVWCDGEITEMIGDSWNEPYEDNDRKTALVVFMYKHGCRSYDKTGILAADLKGFEAVIESAHDHNLISVSYFPVKRYFLTPKGTLLGAIFS